MGFIFGRQIDALPNYQENSLTAGRITGPIGLPSLSKLIVCV